MKKQLESGTSRAMDFNFDWKMKISLLLVLFMSFALQANSTYGQRTKISLNMNNVTVEEVMDEIEARTEFRFIFNTKAVDLERRVFIRVAKSPVADVLKLLFQNVDTAFEIDDRKILLKRSEKKKAETTSPDVATTITVTQDQTVTGTVTDTDGVPLSGANIVEKGTVNGVNADFDGNFSLSLTTENPVLVVSYLGFATQEIAVGDQTEITVQLRESAASLDEVVIIGYGTRNRADLTGAVSTVQAEGISELPVTTFEQALSGQVSGVQLRQNGAPGGGPEVLIRGVASTGDNNAPLYVVDGIPLGNVNSQRDNFVLSSIDPSSIESISILKDASSKAIYGSRASNGVVVITTKRGKTGKPRITFGVSTGFQSIPSFEEPNVLNAEELRRYRIEFFEDQRFATGTLGQGEIAELDRLINLGNQGVGTNWFDEITRQAPLSQYNVGVSGGTENVRYSIQGNYTNQDGTLINTNFKRYSVRANIDVDVSDKIRFGLNLAPTQTIATGGRTDAGGQNFNIFAAVPLSRWTDPSAPVFDGNGELTNVALGNVIPFYNVNPVYLLKGRVDNRRTNQVLAGSFLEVDILKGLTAKTFGSIQYIDRRNNSFEPSDFPGDAALQPNLEGTRQARAGIDEFTNFNWIWENTLRYSITLGENHRIEALAGFTMENRRADNTVINARNLIDESRIIPDSDNVDPADPDNFTGRGQADENSLVSLIGRLDYSFKNKYYLTGTIRRDGSSRFGVDTRYGNFPSVAAAWRVSNEPFWEGIRNLISDFKLEGGYGISGSNANIGNFQAQGRINPANPRDPNPDYIFGGQFAAGSAVTVLPNTLVTWEEAKETNFGVDLGFLDNRLALSVDYYNIETDGFLSGLPLPRSSGFSEVLTNLGSIQNEGFEVELQFNNVFNSNDFIYNATFNFTRNRSEVLDLAAEAGFIRRGAIARQFTETRIGEEVGLYRGFNVTGLFTQEDLDDPNVPKYNDNSQVVGSLKYEDGNGDGILGDEEDFVIIGNPNPDFLYGMVHNFAYKNLDLSLVFAGSVGEQVFNGTNQYNGNQDGVFNVDRRQLDRWRPGDDPNFAVIPGTASSTSRQRFRLPNSLSVDDASYLWVRNITLGYSLPGSMVNNVVSNIRLYTSIQNPFLFTEYENGNPEVNRSADTALVRNVNYGAYPIARVFTLGVNVSF
ncbi:TonB-dependent receptor [Flavobacteriaceae bacterium TP-CH-4]|uniref:TonB-dependent receptor n=1 Tax=Pelagihabitans pacificus TaxID=2696054 RepID=A0A967E9M2_9FLAO|nr:TonB-dependent receptor [Pelagihabitans pacificus]NHF58606.1 TonB-dependent receptor [Pelagihabitans pacificus]